MSKYKFPSLQSARPRSVKCYFTQREHIVILYVRPPQGDLAKMSARETRYHSLLGAISEQSEKVSFWLTWRSIFITSPFVSPKKMRRSDNQAAVLLFFFFSLSTPPTFLLLRTHEELLHLTMCNWSTPHNVCAVADVIVPTVVFFSLSRDARG